MKPVTADDAAFDAVTDLMDEVQRTKQMVARLCEQAGIEPAEAARLPGEAPPPETVRTGQVL